MTAGSKGWDTRGTYNDPRADRTDAPGQSYRPGVGITNPLGDPRLSPDEEKAL